MKSPILFGLTFAIAASVAVAQDTPAVVPDPAIETMTVEQLVKARQDAMRQNGQTLRTVGGLTGEDAVAAATTLLQNFVNFPSLFREGSITPDSRALPAAWENWEDFRSRFDHDAELATAMLAAAQSGDTAAYTAAVEEIGKSCGACHQLYRAEEE
ncbi:MAG TPA: cytochrome c [Devosia sp.]|jgi:cytochrome c556|nr:cytochrome c [Devosia sp.]